MATISENLQVIKDSTDAIKQAIIDKGGNITGDITTWAEVINGISSCNIRFFSLNGQGRYAYEDGMTWKEWCESEYGTMCIIELGYPHGIITCNNNKVNVYAANVGEGFLREEGSSSDIEASSKINPTVKNYIYYVDMGYGQ